MAHGESNGHVTEYKNGMDKYYKWTGVYSGGGCTRVYADIPTSGIVIINNAVNIVNISLLRLLELL